MIKHLVLFPGSILMGHLFKTYGSENLMHYDEYLQDPLLKYAAELCARLTNTF